MNIYKINDIAELLDGNTYPGRGIIIGKTADGKRAVAAYFIMGRSANSRNRIFTERDGAVYTEPFDASKVEDPSLIIYAAIREYENNLIVTNGDPSLIIYAAIREYENNLIVTNGDQTDTIYEGLEKGLSFNKALESREFEPDAPNLTPRISGMLTFEDGDFTYQMSILKSIDPEGSDCARYGFTYPSKAGLGHFIHTYVCDGNPIPTFQGEPERVAIDDDIDAFTDKLWNALDENNKISLYVRTIDLETGEEENRLVNKNK